MVGAVLLLGLTVLSVAVMATILLSGPQPDEIPHATIVAGTGSAGKLALTHEGGDSLRVGEYRIYAGTGGELRDVTDKFTEPPGGAWSIGETLVYDAGTPEKVVVTAVSGGVETILAEPAFEGGGMAFDPDLAGPGATPVVPPDDGGSISPIRIVSPGEGENLVFKNNIAAIKANVTSQDVDRVDLMLYRFDQSHPSDKEKLKRNVTTDLNGDYIWNDIKASDGLQNIKDGNNVVIIAIAYKGEQATGIAVRVATVAGLG